VEKMGWYILPQEKILGIFYEIAPQIKREVQ
jgi:hypothetical protein